VGLYSTPMDPDFTRRLAREIVLTRGPGGSRLATLHYDTYGGKQSRPQTDA